jgi:subtilisin family serine protease
LDRIDQQSLPLSNSYNFSNGDRGNGTKVYVIDTGVLDTHVELVGRVSEGFTAFDDGFGSVDCDGHGTHVAGTIAGSNVGIARKATIVPVKVLNCAGSGTESGVLAGINWVISEHGVGEPAVANLSLGLNGTSSTLDNAINALYGDGVLPVVAAGNSNANACNYSPSRVTLAITVGATDEYDSRTNWSNYGKCVDIFAPGGASYSDEDLPLSSEIYSAGIASDNSYAEMSGTSMAAPHVAGVAARYLSVYPSASPKQVTAALLKVASKNKVASAGSGSPNLLLYANPAGFGIAAASQVTAPRSLVVSYLPETFNSLKVDWSAPQFSGGEEITGYSVSTYNATTRRTISTDTVTERTFTASGLVSGNSYQFEIKAITESFPEGGTAAKSSTAVSYGRPGAVTEISVKNSTGKATISWKAPRDTGKAKITGYEIQLTSTNNSDWTGEWIPTTRTSYVLTGTPVGRQENRAVMIRALTIAGSGPDVPISITVGK